MKNCLDVYVRNSSLVEGVPNVTRLGITERIVVTTDILVFFLVWRPDDNDEEARITKQVREVRLFRRRK